MKHFVIVTVFFLISAMPVFAQETEPTKPGILPSSPFYALDRLWERIGIAIIFDKTAKAERMLMHAEERLAEITQLAEDEETGELDETLAQYQTHIEEILMLLEEAKENDSDADSVLMKVSEATLKHQEVLATVYEKVPEQARSGIENAMEKSMKGHLRATEAVSGEKKEEVEEKNEKVRQDVEERLDTLREEGKPVPTITIPQRRPENVPSSERIEEQRSNIPQVRDIPDKVEEKLPSVAEVKQLPEVVGKTLDL